MDFTRRDFLKIALTLGTGAAFGIVFHLNEQTKNSIQKISAEELSEYDLVTCYNGVNNFDFALINMDFNSDFGLTVKIIKLYDDSMKIEILTNIGSDLEMAKSEFYDKYNIVKTDYALRVFESYLGQNDYFSADDIYYVFEQERKSLVQEPQKRLVK